LIAVSLAALSYDRGQGIAGGAMTSFDYVKGDDCLIVIKVTTKFIVATVTAKAGRTRSGGGGKACGALCSTPELRNYEQLVGVARGR
jgi:hypothetical protein